MKGSINGRRPRDADLLVILNGFPRLSETFVLHELLELERRGVRMQIVALRRPEEIVQQEALDALQAPVAYLPDPGTRGYRLSVRAAHAALLLHSRARYFDGVADVLASSDFSRGALARAAILAHRIVRAGSPPLYVHFANKPATIGRFAAKLAGVRYALSAHAKDIWLTPRDELAAKVRDAETVLACTEEARRYLQQLAADRTPVHLNHHGVEIPRPLPTPRRNSRPVILAVGRLVEKKGYPTLLRAVALLRERGLNFRVRVAGEGPEWARLQRLAHELSIGDRVSFLGPLMGVEVRDEYSRADVFVLPCQKLPNGDRDGLPNVIVEAMAHGLPIVTTTLAGIMEAVDAECGVLVPPGDERALADALERLLREPALRRRLGEAARHRTVERFDRARNFDTVHDALAEAGIVGRRQTRLAAVEEEQPAAA